MPELVLVTEKAFQATVRVYALAVPGEPMPWAVYTRRGAPSKTFLAMQVWQECIRAAIIQAYGKPMLTGPVSLEVVFFRQLPKPWPKSSEVYHRQIREALVKRPDLTNYLKSFEDALKGVLLVDDSQVVQTDARKAVVPHVIAPYTWFRLRSIAND